MKRYITIAIIIYLLVVIAIPIIVFPYTFDDKGNPDWEVFAKVVGVGATLVTSLLAAITSLLVVYKQSESAERLEAVKRDLALQLDLLRARSAIETKAYEKLYGAAVTYYYTLSCLEIGEWDETNIRNVESIMISVCCYITALVNEHRNHWLKFWQKARLIIESARRAGQKDDRKEIWRQHGPEFGKMLVEFETIVSDRHKSLGSTATENV